MHVELDLPTHRRLAANEGTTAAEKCLEAIREKIAAGTLLPGEKLHQGQLSLSLGLSRIPVREALAALRAEGILDYQPNCGYSVARLDLTELYQLYRLRHLLETELLETLPEDQLPAQAIILDALLHAQRATIDSDVVRAAAFNRDFHMTLFVLSPSTVILDEVRRVWNRLEFFQLPFLVSIFASDNARSEILSAHERIIDSTRRGNKRELIVECHKHRLTGLDRLRKLASLRSLAKPVFDVNHAT